MRAFHHPGQVAHAPVSEMHNGGLVPYRETAARVDSVLAGIGAAEMPTDFGMAPLAAVHDATYLDFLRNAHDRWIAGGRAGEALPYVWPVRHRRDLPLDRIDALLGRFSFDATTPVTAATWNAAYASAQTALAATQAVIEGARHAFALCRPPGHHAGADYMGGYCYLNNAAIAAQHAREAGADRVAILDIDYHHGNGTQDIFLARGDVLYVSVHADPVGDYPFYWGHADETGEGGGAGSTLNLPLPRGVTLDAYRGALGTACDAIARFAPDLLVLSFGADTFEDDPIGGFRLRTSDYTAIARDIAALELPCAILLEGGYAVNDLGRNVAAFLDGFG